MHIVLFLGTIRENNLSQHVAEFVAEQARTLPDTKVELISPKSIGLTLDDEGEGAKNKYPELTKQIVSADAFIIVAPEYNHGYPGSLKYLLDLHLREYVHKPVALVGVSSGALGGSRMIESLVGVVRELGMVVSFSDVNVGTIQDQLDEQGSIKDKETWSRRTKRLLDELLWLAETLKWGRENVSSRFHQTQNKG